MIDLMQDPKRPSTFIANTGGETPAEQVLRKLACWLGAGGYNAPTVDADVFHDKIIWGIGELVQETNRLQLEVHRYRDAWNTQRQINELIRPSFTHEEVMNAMHEAEVPDGPFKLMLMIMDTIRADRAADMGDGG